MRLRNHIILCALMALLATVCSADSTIGLTLTYPPNSSLDGYGIGWLNFTVDTSGVVLLLMCDDTTHEINYGLDYIYDSSNLGQDLTDNTISSLEFGGLPNAVTDYEAAAYLAWEYAQADPTGTNSTVSSEYNVAIWTLFDPNGLASGLLPGDPAPGNYQSAALSFVVDPLNSPLLTSIYNNTEIYTPNPSLNGGAFSQEFLGEVGAPEPGTAGIVIAGGVLVVLSQKIRTKRS